MPARPLRRRLVALGLAATLHGAALGQDAPADLSPQPQRDAPSALSAGWQHGAFMEIFVRAYQDSNGDGIGDLQGLIQRLDYLQALGVRGLWLMPITASADHDHGYATTDYRRVEPDYGSLADLDELLRQAHARGIGVVMDYAINHSAASHPLFVASRKGPGNPYRDWYVWSADAPTGWDVWGKNPWYWAGAKPWRYTGDWTAFPPPPAGAQQHYYGTFGGDMPDFNLRNPKVVAWHEDNLRFWLNRGLDGFRLDAVPHLIENDAQHWNDQPESRALTHELQQLITAYPNRFVVCEATANPLAYGAASVCGGAFAFGYTQHFVGAAMGQAASVQQLATYYRSAPATMDTFVSNHDIFGGLRLWDQVHGDLARYRLAAAGYLLQPGTPFIYYGEEVGQASVTGLKGDLPIRSPMSWTPATAPGGFTTGEPFRPLAPNADRFNVQAEQHDPNSLLAFYRAMLRLRNTLPAIAQGRFENAFADDLLLGYQRRLGAQTVQVLINYGLTPRTWTLQGLPAGARLQAAYPSDAEDIAVGTDGRAVLTLAPQSLQVRVVAR